MSGSADGTIRVWDSQTGELQAQLEDHQGAVTCVRFSPDGSMMASASADKTIRLWKFPSNQIIRLAVFLPRPCIKWKEFVKPINWSHLKLGVKLKGRFYS